MPELPEVETFARTLARHIAGKKVGSCRLLFGPLLKAGSRREIGRLAGRTIESVGRRGKYLIIRLQGGQSLVFHLKMTGGFLLVPAGTKPGKHTRLVVTLRGTRRDLHFHDIRKFGCLYAVPTGDLGSFPVLKALGPEPLELGLEDFARLIRGRKGRLKSLLLNQEFIAGIGNIYADESLFRAGLHPLRRASGLKPMEVERLWTSIRHVLRQAVERGGSSIRDYSDSEGRRGRFQESHKAYGREGRPCVQCGTPIVRKVIGGRASFFCPSCQKSPAIGHRSAVHGSGTAARR